MRWIRKCPIVYFKADLHTSDTLCLNFDIRFHSFTTSFRQNDCSLVHITPEKCENARSVIRFRPTVHTNPSRKQSYWKTLFKLKEFEKRRLCVSLQTEIILERQLIGNDDVTLITWLPWPNFLQHKSKLTGDCYAFWVKTVLSNFSGVDGASILR